MLRRVFVSYHHRNDQKYKNRLVKIGRQFGVFYDKSVRVGEFPDHWNDEQIRKSIREKKLRDSTVTILLVGTKTWTRKHIDWELHASMYDVTGNKRSGILVLTLPEVNTHGYYIAAHGNEEKRYMHPNEKDWTEIDTGVFHYLPYRIMENMTRESVAISVVPWIEVINSPEKLQFLIEVTHRDRKNCKYDTSSPLMGRNS